MAYGKLFDKEDIEQLDSDLYAIDRNMQVFYSRGGEFVFHLYDPTTGCPVVESAIFIMRRGVGKCSLLHGTTPFPRSGVHVLEKGWGVAVANISYSTSKAAAMALVRETGMALMWKLRTGIFEMAQGGAFGKLSLQAKYLAHRARMKFAALRAA